MVRNLEMARILQVIVCFSYSGVDKMNETGCLSNIYIIG